MKYILLAWICLSVGAFIGYVIGVLVTLRTIEEVIEEDTEYAERDRYIKS